MLPSPSSSWLYVAGAAPGRMSHGSLWSSGPDASLSISWCLSFPSWLAEVAFAHRVSRAACSARGRRFPSTPGMPPWSSDTQQGMSQPAQMTTTCPHGSPFPGGHQL